MPPLRLIPRLTIAALTVVVLVVVAGLAVADAVLAGRERAITTLTAYDASDAVERYLRSRGEALRSLAPLATSLPASPDDSMRLVQATVSLGGKLDGVRRVWIADSVGVVRAVTALGAGGNAATGLRPGTVLDTISRLGLDTLMKRAREGGELLVASPGVLFTGERGIALLVPSITGGRLTGVVGATIPSTALMRAASRPAPLTDLVILSGADSVGHIEAARRSGTIHTASRRIDVAGSPPWRLVAIRRTPERTVRIWLWVLGLSVLGALAIGVGHEQRQRRRIAERSHELERLSGELLRANRAKSEFLANVSHELRTPLNAIVGFVELLREGVYGELNPRQMGPVQRIEASASHLRHLVDQILDLAKMAAGRLEVHPEQIELRPFVFDVASEMESLTAERGITLSISVGATLPKVRTDPTHLRQIIVNLVANAVKYTEQGGVSVRARLVEESALPAAVLQSAAERTPRPRPPGTTTPPQWIALDVKDTGIGIAPADQERIFDEFEQVNAGPRGESMRRGTGLGLPISRRLARLLGGEVTVESELGKGSTFTLWLPC